MKKYFKFIILMIAFLCLGIAIKLIINLFSVNLDKIMLQKGYTITNQTQKSIDITINKKDLPTNIDFTQDILLEKDDVICYKTGTSTMYLKSIQYANEDTEYLSITFDFDYVLPKEKGKILIPYDVLIKDDETSYSRSVHTRSKKATTNVKVFDNAISLHGRGPRERFSIYIKTDVFAEAKDKISFVVDGFNELSYVKK